MTCNTLTLNERWVASPLGGWVRIVWDGSIKRCIVHRAGVCKLSVNCLRLGVDIDDDVSWAEDEMGLSSAIFRLFSDPQLWLGNTP